MQDGGSTGSTPAASTITRFARSGLGAIVRRRARLRLARALDSRLARRSAQREGGPPPSSRAVRRRPWWSMDVWLCLTRSRTIHDLSPVGPAASCQRRPPTRTRRGYFWGYQAIWGYRCLGGIDNPPVCASLCATRRNVPPHLLELAREANSYGRCTYGHSRSVTVRAGLVSFVDCL